MKIMVTGSRNHADERLICEALDSLVGYWGGDVVLVEGGAPGADYLATCWATDRCYALHTFPADWDRFGKAAGPMRNQQMVDEKPDVVAAFPLPDSRGTWDAVRRAREAGIRVEVFE